MSNENIAIALSDEAFKLLEPMLHLFKTRNWTSEQEQPICIVCDNVNFAGVLIEAQPLSKDGTVSFRIWIPHSYVVAAFDFSAAKKMGFQP
ncbi:MAG: hypothetical protein WBQ69_02095 [Gallionella sp.]